MRQSAVQSDPSTVYSHPLHGRTSSTRPVSESVRASNVRAVTDEEWIAQQVAQAPPLSPSRRNRLALLLASDPAGDKLLTTEPATLASR